MCAAYSIESLDGEKCTAYSIECTVIDRCYSAVLQSVHDFRINVIIVLASSPKSRYYVFAFGTPVSYATRWPQRCTLELICSSI